MWAHREKGIGSVAVHLILDASRTATSQRILPSAALPPKTIIDVGLTMLPLCISLAGGASPDGEAWLQVPWTTLKIHTSAKVPATPLPP